jgi:hypothetical protein
VLAFVIFLPIPLGNILPAIAIVIISFGIIEGDGLLVVVVGAIAVCAILVMMIKCSCSPLCLGNLFPQNENATI